LNAVPVSNVNGKNPQTGVITYSYSYNNRPSNMIAGALSEVVTVTDIYPGDVFAQIPILGRAEGPILQAINTYTARQRQLSIEAVMTPGTLVPDSSAIVVIATPTGTQVFKSNDQVSYSVNTGRYTRQVAWTYEV